MAGTRALKTTSEKRADSRRFAEQIEACVAAHEVLLPRRAWDFLNSMAAEADLWTFRSLVAGLSHEVSNELFFSIAKAMYLSETAVDQRPQRARMREHYADLLACVDKLERSYAGDLMGYEPTKTAALLEGLHYARSDLTAHAREAEDFFAEFVPTRNSNAAATRHANFIATVSTGMEKALGQPHDAEVAKLARFMLGQAVSEGKVRKARRPRQV